MKLRNENSGRIQSSFIFGVSDFINIRTNRSKYRQIQTKCYNISITKNTRKGEHMIIQIDFNSDEAIYMQLRNQIVLGIATSRLQEGDSLPSVRHLAEEVGINMHTVNKAYSVLKEEGLIRMDR